MDKIFFSQAQGARKEQQDAYGSLTSEDQNFHNHAGKLVVVADGMGGLAGGAEASKLTINAFIHAYKQKSKDEGIPEALKRSAIHANKAVYDFSISQGIEGNTGSTLVAVVQANQEIFWISVGDSRIYAVNMNSVTQLSKDHNYEQDLLELVKKGDLTLADVQNNKQKAALTSYIGSESIKKISQNKEALSFTNFSAIVLCSDGFYSKMTDKEIIDLIHSKPSSEVADLSIQKKLEKNIKNQDNLTLGIIFNDHTPKKSKTTKMAFIWLTIIVLPLLAILSLNYESIKIFDNNISNIDDSDTVIESESNSAELIEPQNRLGQDSSSNEVKGIESSSNSFSINPVQIVSETPKEPPTELDQQSEERESEKGELPNVNDVPPTDETLSEIISDTKTPESEASIVEPVSKEKPNQVQVNKVSANLEQSSMDINVAPASPKVREVQKIEKNDQETNETNIAANENQKASIPAPACRFETRYLGIDGAIQVKVCDDIKTPPEASAGDELPKDSAPKKAVKKCKDPGDTSTENRFLAICEESS